MSKKPRAKKPVDQIPDGQIPQFDLSELDEVRGMAQKGAEDALSEPAAAPDMPNEPPQVAPSESGGFDSGEEMLGAIHNLNTSVQQVVQMLQRLLGE